MCFSKLSSESSTKSDLRQFILLSSGIGQIFAVPISLGAPLWGGREYFCCIFCTYLYLLHPPDQDRICVWRCGSRQSRQQAWAPKSGQLWCLHVWSWRYRTNINKWVLEFLVWMVWIISSTGFRLWHKWLLVGNLWDFGPDELDGDFVKPWLRSSFQLIYGRLVKISHHNYTDKGRLEIIWEKVQTAISESCIADFSKNIVVKQ